MNTADEVLNEIIRMAQGTNPFTTIKIGSLPAKNGISMAISGAVTIDRYLDMSATYRVICVLNGKHADQELLSETLNKIHTELNQTKEFSAIAGAQITNVETVALPSKIAEEDGNFLYGSTLRIKFYNRKA